ncbi:Transcription repressor OFP14 [Sesamum angolense]|uniref:Transcription repressor n=1 Tax=Sesamum angolense TaxID=2727404 RepID=A0AAE1XEM9_9LAMI|nr:Transcription repressor OFP14 [Sesamum angolense]
MKSCNKQIQSASRACNRRKRSPAFVAGSKGKANDAVTLSDIRSSYRKKCEGEAARTRETTSFLSESPRFLDPSPPGQLRGSPRFFVASGLSSSLITDEACSSSASATDDSSTAKETEEIGPEDSSAPDEIVILTYSESPYEDFRRSMKEMVETRLEHGGVLDWEFMEELLLCYLDLNNEKSYKHILQAFLDLAVVFE